MMVWTDSDAERDTLPPVVAPRSAEASRLVLAAAERAHEAAVALSELDDLEGGWQRATTELRLVEYDRQRPADALTRFHAALEAARAECARCGVEDEFDGCLQIDPAVGVGGLALVLLDANRTRYGVAEARLLERADRYRDDWSALQALGEELAE